MRTCRPAFTAVFAILALVQSAYAQTSMGPPSSVAAKKAADQRVFSKFSSGYKRQRDATGIYTRGQAGQYMTRLESIRMRLSRDSRYVGLAEPPPEVFDPMTRLLFQRNLLSSRSALADRTSARIGLNDYVIENGQWRGAYTPVVDPAAAKILMDKVNANQYDLPAQMETRLNSKAEELYQRGILYFKEAKYAEARNYFDLVKQLEPDGTRGYIAYFLVSNRRGEGNQAYLSLVRAVQRAKSLDDLKIDRSIFYPRPEDFQRDFDRINIRAKTDVTGGPNQLLLAYFAILYDDFSTSLTAAEAAVTNLENRQKKLAEDGMVDKQLQEYLDVAKRFKDFLQKSQTPPKSPSIG